MNNRATDSSDLRPSALLAALSDAALLLGSSKAIFQRGQTYARSGAVEVTGQASVDRLAVKMQPDRQLADDFDRHRFVRP